MRRVDGIPRDWPDLEPLSFERLHGGRHVGNPIKARGASLSAVPESSSDLTRAAQAVGPDQTRLGRLIAFERAS